MYEQLTKAPAHGIPPVYVTIHEGIGGWNSSVWGWTVAEHISFYEPLQSGFTNTSLGTGERDAAIREARAWAIDEDLPLWLPEMVKEHNEKLKQ